MNNLALAVGGPIMAVPSTPQPRRWGRGREEQAGPARREDMGGALSSQTGQMIFWLDQQSYLCPEAHSLH